MNNVTDYPAVVFVLSFFCIWFSVRIGRFFLRQSNPEASGVPGLNVIQVATLALFVLIVGFSLSMAANRYDLIKSCEQAEATAIGTEYARADLLAGADTAEVRALLKRYLNLRISYYEVGDEQQALRIVADTAELQSQLWSAARISIKDHQESNAFALVISGAIEVLSSEQRARAARLNRIPFAAWGLMATIAICGGLLVGYCWRSPTSQAILGIFLPVVVASSLMVSADIDSPRGGLIRVNPQNLVSLAAALGSR